MTFYQYLRNDPRKKELKKSVTFEFCSDNYTMSDFRKYTWPRTVKDANNF